MREGTLRDLPRRLRGAGRTLRAVGASVARLGNLQDQVEDTDEQQEIEQRAHHITSVPEVEKWKSREVEKSVQRA